MISQKTEEEAIRLINKAFENKKPGTFFTKRYFETTMPDVDAQKLVDVLVAHGYITYGKTWDNDHVHIERQPKCITYFEDKEKAASEKRSERLHDWLIAIFSAFVGALGGALASEPLWRFIHGLFS